MLRGALVVRKKRRATKPTFGSKQARLADKKKRGDTKRNRRPEID
jgi:ribosome-associated protein